MRPGNKSVHYQGMAWTKGNQPQKAPNNPNQHQPNQYAASFTPQGQNPMLQQNKSPFPTNNNQNRPRNFTTQNNFGQSMINLSPQQQQQIRMQQQQQQNIQQMRVAQSMTAQQMRNAMNPSMQQQMRRQQQQQNMQNRSQQMQRQQSGGGGMHPQHRKDNKTKVFGNDPSVPAPPNKNNEPNKSNEANQRVMPGNKLQPNRGPVHFQANSAGNVGPKHRKDNKTKVFGQDPSVPAPPSANTKKVAIQNNANIKPNQLSPQQKQQMNNINKQNQIYQQQQILRNQNQSVRNLSGHQRQIKRNYPQGAWGPSHPYYRQWQMQQRQMAMRRGQVPGQGRGGGAGGGTQNPYYRQWQQYYQRLMQNPQGQLQQMIMQQQQMIGNLKRQLQERDKNYHKTIQTTINFKDMEINELRGQIGKLEEENEEIGELQVQNFQMKKELNGLRGDHQANVFDNLFANMTSSSVNKSKVQWPGGQPPPPSPPNSSTLPAGAHDPKAAINAMLKAKSSPSEMLLTKTVKEKKLDTKDDGKYAKYAKMKKIGMPMVSIVNKMRMDGMSAQEIEEYTGEKVPGSEPKKVKTKGPAVNIADTKFDKYRRMQKLRMPMKTVTNKMKLDGCSQAEIDAFSGKKSSGPSAADKKKARLNEMKQLAETMGLNACCEVLPSKVSKMKRIHWEIIELAAVRKTFWWNINQDTALPEHIDLGGKFELDFQVRARKPRLNAGKGKIKGGLDSITGNSGKKKKSKGDTICWVSAKRNQSIQIALKRIGLPNEVIYDAIADVDEEVMTLDLLEVVWEIVPNNDEQALAEAKVDEIGDDMDNVGISEMFHIEMSTIPEVKQQVSKWLFARTFREVYMDRLQQVNIMQKCANSIKHSVALQTYFRILLSVGNLMNHGTLKGMAYGYKLDSVNKLLAGIKDYSGKKDLGMWLYQFAYNQFPETRSLFEELSAQLKKAIRLEVTTIESSIVKMADEFTAIDLFMRRLHDDFHPGDTERFRQYMNEFQEKQSADMMNLKVKIQNASSICKQVAKFYSIDLEEGKPEFLFVVVQKFVLILEGSKRNLLKLEKERLKIEKKAAAAAAKKRKLDKSKMTIFQRITHKKKKAVEVEEKGNLLFLDIKNAANEFAKRQEEMAQKLESTLKEKKELAKGKVSKSAQKDAIKRRVSAQVMDGGNDSVGGLDMEEIKRLRAMNLGGAANSGPMGNSLMIPGMEMDEIKNDDIQMEQNDYGALQEPQMEINEPVPIPDSDQQENGQMQEIQEAEAEEIEDMNQDIDVQQPETTNVELNETQTTQWDDDDF